MNPELGASLAGEEDEGPAPTEDAPASIASTAFTPGRVKRRSKSGRDLLQRSSSLGFISPAMTPRRRGSLTTTSKTQQSISRTQSSKGTLRPSSVDASLWVPDDMALNCCVCKAEFTMYRRRHHCRTCGRVACDDCSSKRIRGDRTCLLCWDRIGRKMSGLGLASNDDAEVAAAAAAAGGVRKSALVSLLEEERYNRKFVLADGKRVSYSVGGDPDGLPVFLFLGLGCHRHSAAQFEEPARRRGLQLICIDRPGRGLSDPVPSPKVDEQAEGSEEVDVQGLITEAVQEAVVETVKQLCAKLRIAKAGILGQSVGALYALRCARDESLRDVFEGTLVCLVSPWVPLISVERCNPFLQKASSMPALTSTVGLLGLDIMVKQVADMARGSSGASEVEKGYLEAPYTQDLINHVSDVKEGKEATKNEVFLALHNNGEGDAKEQCAAVLHTTKIWHGRSDQLVPYDAMRWLEDALPACTSTIIPGGTHAFVYDKGSMEEVFAAVHKGVQEARSTARFTARRLSSKLSYVASNVFHARQDSLGATAGMMSPRAGKKGDKVTYCSPKGVCAASVRSRSWSITGNETGYDAASCRVRTRFNYRFTTTAFTGTSGGAAFTGYSSPYEVLSVGSHSGECGIISSSRIQGRTSSHVASATSWRRYCSSFAWGPSGSRHGPGGSRHGSESAPAPIPENGELVGWTSGPDSKGDGGDGGGVSPPFSLGGFGKQFGLALNGTFRTEGGVPAEAVPLPSPAASASKDPLDSAAPGVMSGVGRMAEGFMRHLDRAVSSIASRRSSGLLLPWSHQDVSRVGDEGSEVDRSDHPGTNADDEKPTVDRLKRGGGVGPLGRVFAAAGNGSRSSTPRASDLATETGASLKAREGHALSAAAVGNGGASSRSSTPRGIACGTPRGGSSAKTFAAPLTERNLRASTSAAASRNGPPPAASKALLLLEKAAGYEAAMANWPAGKVPGNPAWEEWSPEKKLVCHLVTAGCLAVILLTW
ncbi:unnamed protein product [Scytosiphon promiscuus]